MRKLSLLRSGAFRFAILIAAIFAIGTGVLLAQVEQSVNRYATEVASDSVAAELAVLQGEDRTAGRAELIRSITLREQAVREHQIRYLLVDSQAHRLAGSIPAAAARVGSYDLVLPAIDHGDEGDGAAVSLMAVGVRLSDGAILVVGSDTSDLRDLRQTLGLSTMEFGIGISLLALIGGLVVGTIFLRRLDRVNHAVGRIMLGSLSERLPAIGMSAEFDELSTNLNRMLDRIEALMAGLRQVSTDIAHDLRTPLTRLRQRLEDMKGGLSAAEPVTEEQVEAALEDLAAEGVVQPRPEEARLRHEAAEQLRRVGLDAYLFEQAGNLALGQQRLMEIARALAADPTLLLLDEPAAGLRLKEKEGLADVLRQLRGEGLSILLVEHDMDLVMGLVDRVVVMEFGTKLIEGTPDEVQASPAVRAAYLGTEH